jgi:hypothetical protein
VTVASRHRPGLGSDRRTAQTRIEGFKRPGTDDASMSQATKIVLGTVGISALLALVLVFGILLL